VSCFSCYYVFWSYVIGACFSFNLVQGPIHICFLPQWDFLESVRRVTTCLFQIMRTFCSSLHLSPVKREARRRIENSVSHEGTPSSFERRLEVYIQSYMSSYCKTHVTSRISRPDPTNSLVQVRTRLQSKHRMGRLHLR
jgi:hypothetical protein